MTHSEFITLTWYEWREVVHSGKFTEEYHVVAGDACPLCTSGTLRPVGSSRDLQCVDGCEALFTAHLATPHRDPREYEYPIDAGFLSVDDANEYLADAAAQEHLERTETDAWVLVRMTQQEVAR